MELAEDGKLQYKWSAVKNDNFQATDCTPCLTATGRKQPKSGESPRGTRDGEYLHVDLTGRFNPSIDGKEYGLVIHADFAKVQAAIPIKLKCDAVTHIRAFVNRLETQSGIKVKVIRSDLGTEFFMDEYATKRTGIIHQTTPGYTPELNGVAKRAVGILKTKAAILTIATLLCNAYWSYAFKYAAVILNKTMESGIEGKSAWEVITGRKANVEGIREYGKLCFAIV